MDGPLSFTVHFLSVSSRQKWPRWSLSTACRPVMSWTGAAGKGDDEAEIDACRTWSLTTSKYGSCSFGGKDSSRFDQHHGHHHIRLGESYWQQWTCMVRRLASWGPLAPGVMWDRLRIYDLTPRSGIPTSQIPMPSVEFVVFGRCLS